MTIKEELICEIENKKDFSGIEVVIVHSWTILINPKQIANISR